MESEPRPHKGIPQRDGWDRRGETDLRTLLQSVPNAMVVIDRRGLIVAINAKAEALFGYAPSELLFKPLEQLIPERFRSRHRHHEANFFTNPHARSLGEGRELVGLRKNGTEVPLEISLNPFVHEEQVIGCVVLCVDVTERKRSEQALQLSEERYRTLVEISPEAIFVQQDRQIVFANPTFIDLLAAENPAQVLGKPIRELIHADYHEVVEDRIQTTLQGQSAPPLALKWNRLDGTVVDVEVAAIPFTWQGRPAVQVVARDISERLQAEDALRRSEERHRLLFERNPQPLWVYHLGTLRFLAVNQAAVDHYGYSRREFLAMTLKDIRPAEDVPALLKSVCDAATPIDRAGIWRHRTKEGRIIYVEITEGRIEFEGKAAGLVLANDVTERLQAEDKLRLQATALESAANAIVITDPAGNIQWVNPAFEHLTGYSSGEVIGQNPRLLNSGQQRPGFYKQMWDSILSGNVWEGEIINRRKDGSLYTEFQTITPVHDANGAVTNFVGIKEDVTNRKRAEDALQASEAAYRSIIEGAPYGIYRVRDDGQILMANPAMAQMLGYESPAELVGRNTATDLYLSPEDRGLSAAQWRVKETVPPYEVTWKRKDGKHIVVRLAGRMLHDPGDAIPSYEVFVEDITEKRALEEQFRQAQKMEAVGRLAGGVAHDFNNLLMIIGSYADMIPQQLSDPAKVTKYASQISEASSRAAAVTQQLLAFSRKQVLQPTALNLNVLILGLGKMLPRLLGEDIRMTVAPGATGRVKADATQIEQVIMNLAVNARDAMPEGGRLIIETSDVTLDREYSKRHGIQVPPGDYVMVTVSDSGIGMDAETQAHIFEPFFTTKAMGKGTGLGLATVYGIVKQSGGFIWVYSELGQGSTFNVYLPREEEPEHADTGQAVDRSIPRGSATVLLVEDEDVLRTVAREFLQSLGYTVLDAGNGEAALAIIREHQDPIHLLITDVVMPGMGGPQLAKVAQELRPDLRVIYVSGYTDRAMDRSVIGPGASFLQKPFNLGTLATKIQTLVGGSDQGPDEKT